VTLCAGSSGEVDRLTYSRFSFPDYVNTEFGHNPREHSWTDCGKFPVERSALKVLRSGCPIPRLPVGWCHGMG
jgi:hypothetical protein